MASRLAPQRANSPMYGPDPPTDRIQPVASSAAAGGLPAKRPSSPWRYDHQARSLIWSTGTSSEKPIVARVWRIGERAAALLTQRRRDAEEDAEKLRTRINQVFSA